MDKLSFSQISYFYTFSMYFLCD